MDRFRSLTSRLVLTTVALVALVCLLIAGATTLAMSAYLDGRLDDEVREAVARTLMVRPGPGDEPGRFTAVGSLRANFPEGQAANGYVITAEGDEPPHREDLASDRLRHARRGSGGRRHARRRRTRPRRVPGGRDPRHLRDGGRDDGPGVVVVGLPSDEVDGIISSLVGWEALLTLLGVVAAGSAALVVVRRQLRPLREVAATAHAVSSSRWRRGRSRWRSAYLPTSPTSAPRSARSARPERDARPCRLVAGSTPPQRAAGAAVRG